ncbi:6887_t:CDS:10 [Ambispora leptoticha]|uniref:6887_t:CDS:1 n=1 Tax=Ambispora leptoticha TaxID=144679 RepID=A0A9N8ZEC0_9GLOM|nr:6887_t:CDS:10 [Ambispora leptoticha]
METSIPNSSTSNTQASASPNSASPSLSYFCIYNPSFGSTEETQVNQIIYYVARTTVPMDVKMRQIGLAQGLVNFSRVFSPDKPCENVHTQKNRLAFYEPEPNYWIHISIELGHMKRTTKDKDGKPKSSVEFLDANLHDSNIRRMLEKGYEMYRIFNGPFEHTVRTEGVKALKIKLEEFFSKWVFEWDFEKEELAKIIDGVQYQPLSTTARSEITSFAKKIETDYTFISRNIFILWKDNLIYCGKDDAGNGNDITDADVRSEDITAKPPPPLLSVQSNFLTDSTAELKGTDQRIINPMTIFLKKQIDKNKKRENGHGNDEDHKQDEEDESDEDPKQEEVNGNGEDHKQDEEDDIEECYFLVFNHNSLTLAFLIPVTSIEGTANIENAEFHDSLHEYLTPQMDKMSKVIENDVENSKKIGKLEPDKEYRFLFYNKLTLAIKCSINSSASSNNTSSWTSSASKNLTISGEMAHALCDVYEDLEKYPQMTEIYSKASINFWIVGKRSEGRYLYLVVSRRDATLLEVEDDFRKLSALHFSG